MTNDTYSQGYSDGARQMLSDIKEHITMAEENFIEEEHRAQTTPPKIIIEWYTTNQWGNHRDFVKDPVQAKLLQGITRARCLTPAIRELLRDLTQGHIQWKEVTAP